MPHPQNTLFTGDNLYILTGLDSESVDLIYLDPPFNSKRTYSAPIGSRAAGSSFKDMWTWADIDEAYLERIAQDYPALVAYIQTIGALHSKAMMAYVLYMAQRLIELHRVLKPTGSLYLHCDPTASHYLKNLLDAIFGQENYLNEITWKRTFAHNDPKQFGRIADIILFYTKSKQWTFNPVYTEYDQSYIDNFFRYEDERGKYRLVVLTGPGVNQQDQQWKGYHPANKKRSWSVPRRIVHELSGDKDPDSMSTKQKLDLLYKNGYIEISKKGVPSFKSYLNDLPGAPCQTIWTDINPISAHSKERTGYPTQKPLKLLERIIRASSNAGDMVLDPFCGCATTCVAAQQAGRHWIGIDIEEKAADLVVERLSDDAGLFKNFTHRTDIPKRSDITEEAPSHSIKERLFKKQSGQCNGCYNDMRMVDFEIDHIVPKSKGGGDYYDNYQLLCSNCNRTKGNRPMEYLRTKIKSRQELLSQTLTFGE